ncbi:right-handed parallel beta-helix repeat-containing protein [Streptomyces sp. NPDC051133]|uniref:right-handed parallel beta-helix repeat-containing protein n=1 Tax=Streptomyces sp. NPDC051133 TaxID=3155521 RepID=UPI00343BFFBE
MALYTYGGTPADVLVTSTGDVVPDYPLLVRRAGTGELVTALYEDDGTTPIGELRTNPSSSSQPGAIRPFKVADVTAIDFEYLDASGNPVRWYQAGREVAAGALETAQSALAEADGKLDRATGGTVQGPTTFEQPLTAPNLPDLVGARWFIVAGATGNGVADDRAVIQAQLDAAHAAGGGVVFLPPGKTYGVSTFLVVYDRTVLWAYGATLKATGNSGLVRNFLGTETFTGYSGHSGITLLGGTYDGNASDGTTGSVTSETDVINFVHCSDITVRDVTVLNCSTAHALEFNSTDGGRAINCRFLGFRDNSSGGTRQFSEAVQVDMAKSGSSSIGSFDNTPSRNITISGCYFGPSSRLGPYGRAVGSHTVADTVYYDNITVTGCRIDGTLQEGIHGYGWRRAVISDNVITGTGMAGIKCTVPDPATAGYALTPHSIDIHGNVIDSNASEAAAQVIGFATALYRGVAITGNTSRSSGSVGFRADYTNGPVIADNIVDSSSSTGVFVQWGTDATLSGNSCRSTGSNALNVTGCTGGAVVGNVVNGTSSNFGIFVGQAGDGVSSTDVLVSGNMITAPASSGIRLSTGAVRCTVTSNKVRKGSGAATSAVSMASSATDCALLFNDFAGNGWSASTALSVSTAAPFTGPGGMQALPGTNQVDGDLTPLPALEAALRSSGRFETTSRLRCGTSSTPTSGTLYLVPIWLPRGTVVSNITFVSGGTAAASPTNWWFSLHDSSRKMLARTADQTTTAWPANTVMTKAVAQTTAGSASSYTTTYTGLHYLGIMVKATTQPNIVGEGSVADVVASVSPGYGGTDTGMSTPPTVSGTGFTAGAFGAGSGIMAYAYTS